jgi:putative proteasome-type protease
MTYCLGIVLPAGLVLASDSRSNAGVDQVARVRKFELFTQPGSRVISILSAGNLATTQAVTSQIREALGSGTIDDVFAARSMFEVARIVGDKLRAVIARDGPSVMPYGDPTGSFLVGGQLAGETPRLFQIYSAGNFIEASLRSCFLQIGETKYGKPILDRGLAFETPLHEAVKFGFLSFDSAIRSNLGVARPLDLMAMPRDRTLPILTRRIGEDDPYFDDLSERWSRYLHQATENIPNPPWMPAG